MIITKTFHFYAGHRNQHLNDKCSNLHGHRYGVKCHFQVKRQHPKDSVTTLFDDFDKVQDMLQQDWDHGLIVDKNDPLYNQLMAAEPGCDMKMKVLAFPSSVENVCFALFGEITNLGFDLVQLDIQETESSIVSYNLKDFEMDAMTYSKEEDEEEDRCHHLYDDKNRCKSCNRTRFAIKSEARAQRKSNGG